MSIPLFAECALPGCRLPVDVPGSPCPECLVLFDGSAGGWTIQAGEGAGETAEQVAERKAATLAAQMGQVAAARAHLAAARAVSREPERKQNQTCWMCEERRTCTKARRGWECDRCVLIA